MAKKDKSSAKTPVENTVNVPNNVKQASIELLVDMAKTTIQATKTAANAAKRKQGAYVKAVQVAIITGNAPAFKHVFGHFEEMIRTNVDGLAEAIKAEQGKKHTEDNPQYVLPGAVMSSKSVLVKAFEEGIELGSTEEPRAFSQIRTEASDARKARELAEKLEQGGLEATQIRIAQTIESITALTDKLTNEDEAESVLNSLNDSLEALRAATVGKAAELLAKATDAEALAKAA